MQSIETKADRPAGQWGWVLFDGARGPYNALVNIFVFSAYFTTVVVSDPVRGQALWSYTSSAAALIVALTAPALGAIADAGGRRKPWLAGTLLLGLPCMSLLWFATPGMTAGRAWIMAAAAGSMLFFEFSAIFCNAMLPRVAASGSRIGLLSGLGLAFANLSGVLLFLFFLYAWSWNAHPLFGLDPLQHQPERAVGLMSALWMLIFALPLFQFTADSPATGTDIAAAIRDGLQRLRQTLLQLGEYRNIGLFLVARMVFNEGFVILMLFSGVYAAGVLHWTPERLLLQGLLNSVAAALAGLLAGWLDARIGSRRSLMIFVSGCLLANLVAVSATADSVFFRPLTQPLTEFGGWFPTLPDRVFAASQIAVAAFATGGFSSSRALMARLSPPGLLNEFFGLYAMSGTATTFLGPLTIGVLTSAFQSQRIGFASGVLFLFVGLVLLGRVRG